MFFDRFKHLCAEKGASPTSVVEAVGMNRSAVTYWKKSGAAPKADVAKKIADYLGVPVAELMLEPDRELSMLLSLEPVDAYNHLQTMAENAGAQLSRVRAAAGVRPGEIEQMRRNRKIGDKSVIRLYNQLTLALKNPAPRNADLAYINALLPTLTPEELRRASSILRLMFPDKLSM